MKRILLVRSGPYQVDPRSYNLQEIGLAAAFAKYGIKCDVVYYHKKKNYDEVITKNGVKVNIFWRHGIRLLRSGVYPMLLKKSFFDKYDAVICSEYSQIMSVLFLNKIDTYIYNGPYYNLFKIPIIERMYDALFCTKINKKAKKVFCKTQKAADYLARKGVTNTSVVGVGLDTEKFDSKLIPNQKTESILEKMAGHRNILYIGSISKRKNVELIIKAFNHIGCQPKYQDVQLVIVGKGSKKYSDYCHTLVDESVKKNIIWVDKVENAQTKFLYKSADIFLLPSVKEIFGMVLLEAMYIGIPVISSDSAGAGTLIQNGSNGFIEKEFDEGKWAKKIEELLDDEKVRQRIGNAAHDTIKNEFMWTKIAEKMVKDFPKKD